MFMMVTGGSGSGKSAYAEQQILSLGDCRRYYIATMRCADAESRSRIARHRAMRAGKNFETLECPMDIGSLQIAPGSAVLLECMSNLAANEFFDGGTHTPQETAEHIAAGLARLRRQCAHLIVVTNEIFSEGVQFDEATCRYLECLGRINAEMAASADRVVEVVYGIPVQQKGSSRKR